jgi:hypothetical protein
MWKGYAVLGGTVRENLRREPGIKRAVSMHPAAKSKYDVLKEKYRNENGDTHIDYNVVNGVVEKTNGVSGISHLTEDRNINNRCLDVENLVLGSTH